MILVSQLLWIETLLKGTAGLALFLAPLTLAKLFGLPSVQDSLWMRLLGALLLGVAMAIFLQGTRYTSQGIGLAGLLAINLVSAGALAALLLANSAASTRRGRLILWLLTGLLLILAFGEGVTLTVL